MRISDWSSDVCSSDLNVVIRKVVRRRRRRLALGRLRLPLRRGILARTRRALTAATTATTAATAFTTATEHLHLVGDDLGVVLLHPVLAGVLVVADLDFNVDLPALAPVLAGDLAELAEEGPPVPLGVFLRLAVAVLAVTGSRQAYIGHGHVTLRGLLFRVFSEISHQCC